MKQSPRHVRVQDEINILIHLQLSGQLDWVSSRAKWDTLLPQLMDNPDIDLAGALTMALHLTRSHSQECSTQNKSSK